MLKIVDYSIRARHLRLQLFMQILTAPIVIVIFKTIESRATAGLVAGSLFILVGIFLVYFNYRWVSYLKSPTFWLSCIHLFAIALPIFLYRTTNLDVPFDELLIMGIPGPVLHKISERVFTILILSTFGELIYTRHQLNKARLISNKTL